MLAFDIPAKRGHDFYRRRQKRLTARLAKVTMKVNAKRDLQVVFERYHLPEKHYLILYFSVEKVKYSLLIEGDYMKYYMAKQNENDNIKLSENAITRIITEGRDRWKVI